jgi:signal transduction histidine kinase
MDTPGKTSEGLLYKQQVRQLYKHLPIAIAGTSINSLILTFILWPATSHAALIVWLAVSLLVSFLRFLLYLHYLRSMNEPAPYGRLEMWFNITLGLSGMVWGAAGIFLFPPHSIPHQIFIAFVVGGMIAGAAGTYSVMLRSFLIFSLPALIPITLRLIAAGDQIHLAMGGMALLFGILMFSTAKRVNTALVSSLRLQFENRDLVLRLERRVGERTAEIVKANEELKQEIEMRKAAEKASFELNENLECRIRERTAELERRSRELQEFAFVAAHDLSEPLRKIKTLGSFLEVKSAELGKKERDYISRMTRSATRMQELLDALLRYSQIDTRGEEFIPTRLDEVVQEVTNDLEMEVRQVGADVEIGSLPVVFGDPSQLRQLFQNLVANALKYRRSGVTPHIKIYGGEDDGGCRVIVEDNGIGFDEKYLDKIFQPFQRLHGKNEYSGTGIGLAICKKILDRHGGTITAISTPGKGSAFVMTFSVRSQQLTDPGPSQGKADLQKSGDKEDNLETANRLEC